MTDSVVSPGIAGRFGRLEFLGRGGMGEVYKAYDVELKRDVALKIILPHFLIDRRVRRRFQREIRSLATVKHPNVVRFFDCDDEDGQLFYTMEYVEGQDLAEVIAEGNMNLERAVEVVKAVASGLQAIHERNIVHRDIKPENIVIAKDGRPRLIDFGLVKLLGPEQVTALTKQQELVGTIRYMPPEFFSSNEVTAQSDIFSLGLVAHELLTGVHPIANSSLTDLLTGAGFEKRPATETVGKNLPAFVCHIVDTCLAPRPENRYPTAAALVEALERQDNKPLKAKRSRPRARAPEGAKPFRYLPLALLVCIILGVFLLGRQGPVPMKIDELQLQLGPGNHAVLTYRSSRPCVSALRFDDEKVKVKDVGGQKPKREHRLVLEGLEAQREYSFRVLYDENSSSLPLVFSTLSPIRYYALKKDDDGHLQLLFATRSALRCELAGGFGKEAGQQLEVQSEKGGLQHRVLLPKEKIPAFFTLTLRGGRTVSIVRQERFSYAELVDWAIEACPAVEVARSIFAKARKGEVDKRQFSFSVSKEDLGALLMLLARGEKACRVIFEAPKEAVDRLKLYEELTLLRQMALYARLALAKRLRALSSLHKSFVTIEPLNRKEFLKQRERARSVLSHEQIVYLLPKNFPRGAGAGGVRAVLQGAIPNSRTTEKIVCDLTAGDALNDDTLSLLLRWENLKLDALLCLDIAGAPRVVITSDEKPDFSVVLERHRKRKERPLSAAKDKEEAISRYRYGLVRVPIQGKDGQRLRLRFSNHARSLQSFVPVLHAVYVVVP